MATTTQRGFRIPENTDPVANGAQAVANLGNDVDDKIGVLAMGTVNVNMGGTANATANVVFPVGRFVGTAPVVVTGSNHGNYDAYVEAVTTAGFTMRVKHRTDANTAVNVPIYWIAGLQ